MKPLKIHQVARDQLLVQWDDGHESTFTTEYLRTNCPCAVCAHEREENLKSGIFSLPLASKTRLVRIDHSGRNAMVITWGDGHTTGIYTWEYLRSLCCCDQCRK
jgi:DUF971 family protein